MSSIEVSTSAPTSNESVAKRSLAQTLTFFFRHRPYRMILPFIFGLLYAIPIPFIGPAVGSLLGGIPMRGWRLHIVRRMVRKDKEYLPAINQFGELLKDGLVLLVMQGLYWAPHAILIALFSDDWVTLITQLWDWAYTHFWVSQVASNAQTLSEIMTTALQNLATVIPFHIIFWFISWPIYRIGMMRYALTGNWKCFLGIKENFMVGIRRNYFHVLKLLFAMFFIEGFVSFVSSLVTALKIFVPAFAVCSVLVEPFLQPLSYTTTGYLWGSVAQEFRERGDLE